MIDITQSTSCNFLSCGHSSYWKTSMSGMCMACRAELAEKRVAELEGAVLAGMRLCVNSYYPWTRAGGEDECKHGLAKLWPCRRCDLELLIKTAEIIKKQQENKT